MLNEYKIFNSKILKIAPEGADSKLFTLTMPYKDFNFECGQYVMVSVPGLGESAISISSDLNERKFFQLTIRKCGALTSAVHNMKVGDTLGIRGPYGRPFPLDLAKGKNILIVAGGIGIEPLRPLILDALKNPKKYNKVYIFCGSRDESMMLYTKEYPAWRKVCDLSLTLDNPKTKKYAKGQVTMLFDTKNIPTDAMAFMCGPPIMYKFVMEKMLAKGFYPDNIYVSLERHMDCAKGVCQHCAIGPYYVCKDGPVFSYSELAKFKSWLSPL